MPERELLEFWCRIFEYQPADMQVFDQVLLPAVVGGGVSALAEIAAAAMAEILFASPGKITKKEAEALEIVLLDDAARIILSMEKSDREGGD